MMKKKMILLLPLVIILCMTSVHAQMKKDKLATADEVVDKLYDLVSFYPGQEVNWDRVSALFIEDAVIVLRTTRKETTIFNVDGFVADFIQFIDRAQAYKTGFTEKIIRKKSVIMGDMAHILVLYEAYIPGSTNPPQRGVDSFSLIQKDNRWWIVSVINEIPTLEVPIPEVLQE
jgi:hypothetical protein